MPRRLLIAAPLRPNSAPMMTCNFPVAASSSNRLSSSGVHFLLLFFGTGADGQKRYFVINLPKAYLVPCPCNGWQPFASKRFNLTIPSAFPVMVMRGRRSSCRGLQMKRSDSHRLLARFFKRTPAPPPFSAMNSTPAFSRAACSLSLVSGRPPIGSLASIASRRPIVGFDIPEAAARSSCDQPNRDRAALI
jgi:hypothetical protein